MKKYKVIFMAICLGLLFSQSLLADTCEGERETIELLKQGIQKLEKELDVVRHNRNRTAVSALITLGSSVLLGTKGGVDMQRIAMTLGGLSALSGINIYIAQNEIGYYEESLDALKQFVEEKKDNINLGRCVSEQIKKSTNQKARELYEQLVIVNRSLNDALTNLQEKLGNGGVEASSYVTLTSNILLCAAAGLIGTPGIMAVIPAAILAVGGQAINMPSLVISQIEARYLLPKVLREYERSLAQEEVLRVVLGKK